MTPILPSDAEKWMAEVESEQATANELVDEAHSLQDQAVELMERARRHREQAEEMRMLVGMFVKQQAGGD